MKKMISRTTLQTLGVLALVAALLSTAAWLQQVRETQYSLSGSGDETLIITSGPALRRFAVAYQALAADLYWIRAIQHFGRTRQALVVPGQASGAPGVEPYALLYPLLDLTTTLDPVFNVAYRFGAIFLAEPYPGGPARPDLAIALLEKGLSERPDKWEYMHDIGFVYYWWRQDYKAAADWFLRAGQVPGAPSWLRLLAATTLAVGGDRQSSRLIWESLRESAEIDWLRRNAERRLAQLDAMDQIDVLQKVVDQAIDRFGTPAGGWQRLISAGILPGVPADPLGTPYEIDRNGRVRLSSSSPLFPLPGEPQRMTAPRP